MKAVVFHGLGDIGLNDVDEAALVETWRCRDAGDDLRDLRDQSAPGAGCLRADESSDFSQNIRHGSAETSGSAGNAGDDVCVRPEVSEDVP
jgi:hypothetical protein